MGKIKKVVDCWATWCGPCKSFSSTFEMASKNEKYKDVNFEKLNIEDEGSIEIVEKYQIRSIPTVLILDEDDNIIKKVIGNIPLKDLEFIIDTCMEEGNLK